MDNYVEVMKIIKPKQKVAISSAVASYYSGMLEDAYEKQALDPDDESKGSNTNFILGAVAKKMNFGQLGLNLGHLSDTNR